jgi:hypothetical protein
VTDWLSSDLLISHFFSFRCPLINTPQLNTQPNSTTELLNSLTSEPMPNQLCVLPLQFQDEPKRSPFPAAPLLFCVYALLRKRVNFVATIWFSRVYFQFSYPWKTCSVTSWFPRINLFAATHLPIRFLETAYMSKCISDNYERYLLTRGLLLSASITTHSHWKILLPLSPNLSPGTKVRKWRNGSLLKLLLYTSTRAGRL